MSDEKIRGQTVDAEGIPLDAKEDAPSKKSGPAFCSFCGKSKGEVKKLIAGPVAWICNECVNLMAWMLKEDGITDPYDDVPHNTAAK